MNKISGILPATARITSVNLEEARPVRAGGVPSFGIPTALSSSQQTALDKLNLEKALNPQDVFEKSAELQSRQISSPVVEKQMENQFFQREALGTSGYALQQESLESTGLGSVSVRA